MFCLSHYSNILKSLARAKFPKKIAAAQQRCSKDHLNRVQDQSQGHTRRGLRPNPPQWEISTSHTNVKHANHTLQIEPYDPHCHKNTLRKPTHVQLFDCRKSWSGSRETSQSNNPKAVAEMNYTCGNVAVFSISKPIQNTDELSLNIFIRHSFAVSLCVCVCVREGAQGRLTALNSETKLEMTNESSVAFEGGGSTSDRGNDVIKWLRQCTGHLGIFSGRTRTSKDL